MFTAPASPSLKMALLNGRRIMMACLELQKTQTTSNDLAKFMIAMQDAYLGKPNPLLRTETARQMLTRQPNSKFGLGFAVHGEGDAIAFGHDGSTIGFQADFICFPNKGMGAIVMTNSDNGFSLMRAIFLDAVRLDLETLQRCAGEFVNSAEKIFFFIPTPFFVVLDNPRKFL